jgi:transposase-like protein
MMVFAPFTGVDNHNKSITFGAALLAKEDAESYVWLFQTFLKAMKMKEPNCFITDQDPGMRKAFEEVFTQSRHRLCMWHIMQKLPVKVSCILNL